jgi:hypothetical protein
VVLERLWYMFGPLVPSNQTIKPRPYQSTNQSNQRKKQKIVTTTSKHPPSVDEGIILVGATP